MVFHRERPGRTVVQQIANLWRDYGVSGKPMGEAVRSAFDVQPVTEAFFKDCKAAYNDAVESLATSIDREDAEQFAQTLFNRLLFIHFASKKGWLRFNGDTEYLNALWQDYGTGLGDGNFYRDRLLPLFFSGLNNPDAITPMQAPAIHQAVRNMKAVDPACGSGAYLLGMMQEILALNDSLFRAGHTPESLYRQKLDIISNNIHGADKDALAVSTAMLRLWLSLAVDYEGDGVPAPLPNLDLKLAAGDAIAGPDPQQLDFTLQGIVNSGLRENIAEYTTAQGQRKTTLKQEIADTKQ